MDTTSCPRCVAERRAQRARVTLRVSAGLAASVGVVSGRFWTAEVMPLSTNLSAGVPGSASTPAIVTALALACMAVGLSVVVDHLDGRASTPLPPPAADPLATYREAPVACPRHPFAR